MQNDSNQPGSGLPKTTPVDSNRSLKIVGSLLLIVVVVVGSYFGIRAISHARTTNHTAATSSVKIASATVSITAHGFSPATTSVSTGQAVVWVNNDSTPHLVISSNPKPVFSSQQVLAPNDSFGYVFNQAGTYPYYDSNNPGLKGAIIVK